MNAPLMQEPGTPGLDARAAAVLADDIEAAAFEDLYAAAPPALRDQLGLGVQRIADATLLTAPGLPDPMFNRAIGLGLRGPADPGQVEAIASAYRTARCPHWWLHWNPHATPEGLEARLPPLGFTQPARRSWAKVVRSAADAPRVATDLLVTPAARAHVDAVTGAIATSFGMPPFMADWLAALHSRQGWRLYAVCEGAEVVGGGCLFAWGDAAWLGMGAVLPAYRRRGGQGALMARRIADAGDAGARHVVTETGEPVAGEPNPSLSNMQRCGFVTVASRRNWVGPQ